ncbi:hypothetical protein PIB30_015641 [Stylosanthes scabra]|uniref:F-box domain-containing protein n=1 Tax=Stylosanthes scabra TaxID=79078 RepID=A0ABU6T6S1_9FABA|nr:hypothetical protein [Stylosanthes scabra]
MEIDIISNLPDSLLCHILSFLPTFDAVCTDILSRRWRHVWKDLQVFDFDDERIKGSERFVSFVESVLSRRSFRVIHKFSLSCYSLYDLNPLRLWVRAAIGPCLQEMIVNFYDYDARNSIGIIFPRASLVTLSPVGFSGMDNVPLHLLKDLKPRTPGPGVFVESNLVSGCPALENLYFIFSTDKYLTKIFFFSETLKRVRLVESRIYGYSKFREIEIDARNLEFLRIYLEGSCVRNLTISDFPNMMEASIDIAPMDEHVAWLPKLLKALSKTKKLHLGWFTTQGQHGGNHTPPEPSSWTRPASVPSCVMLHLNILEFRRYPDSSEEREFFAYILQNALALKAIIIYTNIGSYEKEKEHILNEISALPRGSSLCQVEEFRILKWYASS